MQLKKHPVLLQGHNVIIAIEECGCSEKLTRAVTMTVKLNDEIEKIIDQSFAVAVLYNYKVEESIRLLDAVKCAYRKHHLGDESIGWNELSDILLNALCKAMTDKGYQEWIKSLAR